MKSFTIENPLPPLWLMYPEIASLSIGWRMGYGESYRYTFWDWYGALSESDAKIYRERYPEPRIWEGIYNSNHDSEEDFYFKGVRFWREEGKPDYSIEALKLKKGKHVYVFFWKPDPEDIRSCLGQWQPSEFLANEHEYSCTEQYMMAEKAELFGDSEHFKQIMATKSPKKMKALGRKVRDFNAKDWDYAKYSIVLNGNYHKFAQNEEMRNYLLSTGTKILVEASPLDKIWGIGLKKSDIRASNPDDWRGDNLLGFALMEVRDELKRVYSNFDKIDWEHVKRVFP